MIVRSLDGDVSVRAVEFDSSAFKIPAPGAEGANSTGMTVSWQDAYGLPAVLYCLLLAARTVSQLPCDVYKPAGEGSEKAYDAPQRELLHTNPHGSTTPRTLWYPTVANLLGHGNALIQKLIAPGPRREVVGLRAVAASRFRIVRRDGEVCYYLGREKVDPRSLIHIAGDVLDDPEIGISPLTLAREAIAAGRAAQIFEGRYFRTEGTPSEMIVWNKEPTKEQRTEFASQWEARHKPGTRKLGQIWNAEYKQISVSMQDAQWAESQKLSTTRAAQILGMPAGIVDPEADQDPAQTNTRFRELFVQPLLTAIEQSLHVDEDLFPDKSLFPRFITNALLRPSLKDRADAYRLLRQGGIETANELRRLEDLPDHPDGDELQATPVGGAPNPAKSSASDFS